MNPSVFPIFSPQKATERPSSAVYANLNTLIRLQVKASGFSFLPRQPIHSILAGRHASRLRGRGLNFEEIRAYLPGDDVRNMDWKVTARTRKPHIRVYTEERDRPVWLLVDQRMSMFFGSRGAMKSVRAAEVTALSAWRTRAVGDRVGALIFNDNEITLLRPASSLDSITRLLGSVVKFNQKLGLQNATPPNPAQLNRALEQMQRIAAHDALIVLISDGDGMDEQSTRQITRLSEHNDVLAVSILDPMEEELPMGANRIISDGFHQLEMPSEKASIARKYHEETIQRREAFVRLSRLRSIPLLRVRTDEDPLPQIRRQIGEASS